MPIPHLKSKFPRAAKLPRLEVVLVLILIAVLMTMLLNRLSELNGMLRSTRLQMAMGTVHSAAALFHARCIVLRQQQSGCAVLALNGTPVAGVNDFPAATGEGIVRAAALPASRTDPFRFKPARARGLPALSFSLGESGCEFLYVQAKSPDEFPEVDIVDASCH